MDERQQKQINEAAEKFADAIRESYQAVTDRSVSARELNAQLTQDFFNGVIDNLKHQTESNRALTEDLIEQQWKQREAAQSMARETGKPRSRWPGRRGTRTRSSSTRCFPTTRATWTGPETPPRSNGGR